MDLRAVERHVVVHGLSLVGHPPGYVLLHNGFELLRGHPRVSPDDGVDGLHLPAVEFREDVVRCNIGWGDGIRLPGRVGIEHEAAWNVSPVGSYGEPVIGDEFPDGTIEVDGDRAVPAVDVGLAGEMFLGPDVVFEVAEIAELLEGVAGEMRRTVEFKASADDYFEHGLYEEGILIKEMVRVIHRYQ